MRIAIVADESRYGLSTSKGLRDDVFLRVALLRELTVTKPTLHTRLKPKTAGTRKGTPPLRVSTSVAGFITIIRLLRRVAVWWCLVRPGDAAFRRTPPSILEHYTHGATRQVPPCRCCRCCRCVGGRRPRVQLAGQRRRPPPLCMSAPNSHICRPIVQLRRLRGRALVVVDDGKKPQAFSMPHISFLGRGLADSPSNIRSVSFLVPWCAGWSTS